jgi:hypothetical protein
MRNYSKTVNMKTPHQKSLIFAFVALMILSFSCAFGQSIENPVFTYLTDISLTDTAAIILYGPARVIELNGREGLNTTSIHSVLQIKAHNMKQKEGTVSMWVMSLEDLGRSNPKPMMDISNPNCNYYLLLSDCPNPQDFRAAKFKMV